MSVEEIADHEMHEEWYRLSESTAAAVNKALDEDRRIVCVGTTSVRALEGALAVGDGRVNPATVGPASSSLRDSNSAESAPC